MCEGAEKESQQCDSCSTCEPQQLCHGSLLHLPTATGTSPMLSPSRLQECIVILFWAHQEEAMGGAERRAPIFQGRGICPLQSSRDCGQPQPRIKSCSLEGVPAGVNSHAVKQQVLKARPHKSTKLDAGDIIDPFC